MACKINHADADSLPQSMCRHCRPELNATPEQIAEATAAERKRIAAELAAERRKRELIKARQRLESLTRKGEPAEGTVNAQIAKSMRKKIARLQREEANADRG
jgi:hypothetical protein